MKTFVEYFEIILTGNKDDSRKAARDVKKLLRISHSGQYKDIAVIIENAPREYANIAEDWRQENFVIAVSVLYFLHDDKNLPDFLFPWLFCLLQHENGNIRYASVRMLESEFGRLTVHIRFPGRKFSDQLTPERADVILLDLFMNLNNLLNSLWKPVYKKYKYVSSLPVSSFKSVHMVLSEMEDDCGETYMKRLESNLC